MPGNGGIFITGLKPGETLENFETDFEIFDEEKSRAEETAISEKKKAGRAETETMTRGKEKAKVKRKKRKSLKRIFEYLLSLELGEEGVLLAGKEGFVSRGMTVNEAIAAVWVAKAVKGDAKAFELIRNTLGEKDRRAEDIPPVLIIRRDGSRHVI